MTHPVGQVLPFQSKRLSLIYNWAFLSNQLWKLQSLNKLHLNGKLMGDYDMFLEYIKATERSLDALESSVAWIALRN